MRRAAATLTAAVLLACAAPAAAAPTLVPVGDFDAPLYATAPPRDTERLFVAEQEGLVKVVHNGVVQPDPFIDLSGTVLVGSERGLLSLAFPPDYATTGLVYTYLTGPGGELQVREHRRAAGDANRTEPGSRLVWRQAHDAGNHNGARAGPGRRAPGAHGASEPRDRPQAASRAAAARTGYRGDQRARA